MRSAKVSAITYLLCIGTAVSALALESRPYVRTIPDAATFETYSRVVGAERFSKFLIDVKTDEIYYFDVNLFRMHSDFVFSQFYKRPMRNEDIPEYNRNYDAEKPRFILGYITHHLKTGLWTYSFWEGDAITARHIRRVRDKLAATFFQKEIAFRPDSPRQEKRLAELRDIPTITNDKIYKAASFQSFNNGATVGRLRVVPPGTKLESLIFDRDDIVILQESYPDITPVAGIISTVFSTPLSHVNLRAREWGIPNAGIVDAAAKLGKYDGLMMTFEVRDIDYTLRPATAAEVQTWKERAQAARAVFVPRADLTTRELRDLHRMRAEDRVSYGTKAANLGEIASSGLGVPVPRGFGVPFAYYVDHLERSGLDEQVEAMLADPRFTADAAWRRQALEALRGKIRAAPINPATLEVVWKKVQKDLGGRGVFVRSSTNAEDLEGFNGAGLYDTVPNVKGKAALGEALKRVWSSIWNAHAFEERALFNIDHRACAGAVLVQVGVNATAAGVLITRNLYDPEDARGYTINAKRGLGLRVVGGTTIPEQIIYDPGNRGTKILSRSDDPTMLVFDGDGGVREVPNPNRGVILTEARARALSETVRRFVPLFSSKHPLDVEWVLEREKVWIVQARPYVGK
jgi:hypothetical protein